MTTKRTKKTETTETAGSKEPLRLHTATMSIEEVESRLPITESLDDIVAGVNKLTTSLERQRPDEFRIRPWHLLAAFWLGAVSAVAGMTAANKEMVVRYAVDRKAA